MWDMGFGMQIQDLGQRTWDAEVGHRIQDEDAKQRMEDPGCNCGMDLGCGIEHLGVTWRLSISDIDTGGKIQDADMEDRIQDTDAGWGMDD